MADFPNLYTYLGECYVVVNEYGGILPDSEFGSEDGCNSFFAEHHDGKLPAAYGCVVVRIHPIAVSGDPNHRLFKT